MSSMTIASIYCPGFGENRGKWRRHAGSKWKIDFTAKNMAATNGTNFIRSLLLCPPAGHLGQFFPFSALCLWLGRCNSPYALAVHGNQRHNDPSLVFHFNFMERDACPKDNCQRDWVGEQEYMLGWILFSLCLHSVLIRYFDCSERRLIDNLKTIVGSQRSDDENPLKTPQSLK